MDDFRQTDEAKQEMKSRKFRARCIQWDRTDDDGSEIEADLPAEVIVTLEDLQLPIDATTEEIEDALAIYLTDYYGFCHNGFFFEEVDK